MASMYIPNIPSKHTLTLHCREIIDESDVYIDVHKAIRRLAPAPTYRRAQKGQIVTDPDIPKLHSLNETLIDIAEQQSKEDSPKRRQGSLDARASTQSPGTFGTSPKTTFMVRRGSSAADGSTITVRGNATDMREHLKHLGPSNLASRPKQTRYTTVKIKPGHVVDSKVQPSSVSEEPYRDDPEHYTAAHGGEGEGLLQSAGRQASDGVLALQQGYGSVDLHSNRAPPSPQQVHKSQQVNLEGPAESLINKDSASSDSPHSPSRRLESRGTDSASDTVSSLVRSRQVSPIPRKRGIARSGSITENIVDTNGVRKVVLQTARPSGGDGAEDSYGFTDVTGTNMENGVSSTETSPDDSAPSTSNHTEGEEVKKKSKRRRKRKNLKDEEGGE